MRATRVCLLGLGKTGKEVARFLLSQNDIQLVAVFVSRGSDKKGRNLGELLSMGETSLIVKDVGELESFVSANLVDVTVDFTSPDATLENAAVLAKNHVHMVVGTTGFNEIQLRKLKSIAERGKVGLVYTPNVTLGVNVLMLLSKLAFSILDGYDCNIIEAHFKGKKDAPSGTADKLAKNLERSRRGTDSRKGEITIQSIRAGGIVGTHTVQFAGEHDLIEIKHESFSRKAFAAGAVRAVQFIKNRVGYYEMQEVLNMQHVMETFWHGMDQTSRAIACGGELSPKTLKKKSGVSLKADSGRDET